MAPPSPAAFVAVLVLCGMVLLLLAASLLIGIRLLRGAQNLFLERSRLRLRPIDPHAFRQANRDLVPAPERRMVLFGDSRAAQMTLPRAGAGLQLVNRGCSGESTVQMGWRLESDLLGLKPDLVVLFAGINDLVAAASVPEMEREAVATTAANLVHFARAAAGTGSRVLLLTIVRPAAVRLVRRPFWSERVRDLVTEVNDALRALSVPGVEVLDVDRLLAREARCLPRIFATDEIHLSPAAYATIDAEIARRLAERK